MLLEKHLECHGTDKGLGWENPGVQQIGVYAPGIKLCFLGIQLEPTTLDPLAYLSPLTQKQPPWGFSGF